MTDWSVEYMHRDGQLFRRHIGEVVAALLKARFPRDTAKVVERRYDLDPSTAKNVIKGHASARSLTNVLYGEGADVFALLDAIGHALTGQTREQWEEARLQKIIQEAEHAQSRITQLRTRRALLAEGLQGDDEAQPRQAPDHQGATPTRQGRRSA